GVLAVRGGEVGERARRARDHAVVVAEHVDGGRGEMSCAHAFREYCDALAGFCEPKRGREPGEPGADHDRLVRGLLTAGSAPPWVGHSGRCWAPRRPWKIQSSSRACRNWSPWRIGWTPFQRSRRKSSSAEFASCSSSCSKPCRIPVAR